MRTISSFILSFLIFLLFMLVYLKYLERKGIYYPSRTIEVTPEDFGWEYEDVYFTSRDNLKLNGWFIPAKDARATLLFCHGNAGNISHRLEIIEIFRNLKLSVFIFDYRGYGKSPGSPSEQGFYRDAEAAYDYLCGRRDIDRTKFIVYGKSIGANVAIELVSKKKTKLLISESAFSSAVDMAKKLYPFLPVKWIVSIKYDALTKIKDIQIPKLIIHSQDDEIVPFNQGEKLFAAAAAPKEFYIMRGGHNEAVLMAKQEFSSRINEFLKRHLRER